MTLTRLLAFSFLSGSTILACGGASGSSTSDSSTGATGGTGAAAGTGGVGGTGAGDGGLNLGGGPGTGGGTPECEHLNIGILGNAGANPSSNFEQWLVMSGTSVQRIQTSPGEPLTAAALQPFDVVVLDWLTRDYTAAEAAILASFVTAGGGVASMTGYDGNTTDDWHANSLLAPLQVAYSGPLINGPATTFAAHPITAGLTSVTFAGGYAISDLGGNAGTRTPIAFLPQGNGDVTIGVAIQMGAGHAFVWGDEWIEFDSEWSSLPQIKQLWVQVFGWISPMNTCALSPPE